MTSGQLIGPEELSAYATEVFRDRIEARDEHLRRAAEVTRSWEVEESSGGNAPVRKAELRTQEEEPVTLAYVPVDRLLAAAPGPLPPPPRPASFDAPLRKTR
jgi:hypothetical protein